MDTGNHIGEYIKEKLIKDGRQLSWLAKKLDVTRQNILKTIFEKHELVPSKVKQIEKAIGDPHFFDEFFKRNNLTRFYSSKPVDSAIVEEGSPSSKDGYMLSIQVDPDNFNAEKLHRLVDVMHEVSKKMKE